VRPHQPAPPEEEAEVERWNERWERRKRREKKKKSLRRGRKNTSQPHSFDFSAFLFPFLSFFRFFVFPFISVPTVCKRTPRQREWTFSPLF